MVEFLLREHHQLLTMEVMEPVQMLPTEISARALLKAASCCICCRIWAFTPSEEVELEPPKEREDMARMADGQRTVYQCGLSTQLKFSCKYRLGYRCR